jgi:hypothetical protein
LDWTLVLALITHFIADFICQSRKMGKYKSSSIYWLSAHILIIFSLFTPFGLKFAIKNALIHMLIDGTIWNGYKLSVKLRDKNATASTWKYWKDHWFYVTIGFDQLLHVLTIVWLL